MFSFDTDLQFGSLGRKVSELQTSLELLGYGDFKITGFFGNATREAVIKFQKDHKIEPTVGLFGPITRRAMFKDLMTSQRVKLYATAVSCLGIDASPADVAPDEYGCAETVSDILIISGINLPVLTLTTDLYRHFIKHFQRTTEPLPGDIIISPTGYGMTGIIPNGHVGIMYTGGRIMSNSSATGTFEINYSLDSWGARYGKQGGYPVEFFRV